MPKTKGFSLKFRGAVLLLLGTLVLQQAQSQGKVDVAAGAALPEMLYGGLRLQLKPFQLGGSVGTVPLLHNESVLTVSGDLFFHFAGRARYSDRRPVYLRTGVTYLRDELKSESIDKVTYLNVRIGSDLNFSKRFGMNIDGGASFELTKERVDLNPSNDNDWFSGFAIDFPVVPAVTVGVFCRL